MAALIDYTAATYTANARIRIMCDAISALDALKSRLDEGSLTEDVYADAAAINIVAYADQLHFLPPDFWNELSLDKYADAEILVTIRNNLAHTHRRVAPDFDFIHQTATRDIPRIHQYVMAFYTEKDIQNNHMAYPTDRLTKHKFRLTKEEDRRQYGFPTKYLGTISENKKKRR